MRSKLMFKLLRKYGFEGKEYKELDSFISRMKRSGIEPTQAIETADTEFESAAAQAYREYDRTMRQEGWLDFDSFLTESLHLLQTNAGVRSRWQFEAIQVDEAQDTDDLQFKTLQLISEKHGRVFAVGDPNQALYGFRGAKPDNILKFNEWFADATFLYLGMNYRSTQTIVDYCRKHVPVETGLTERMVSASGEAGPPIEYFAYGNSDEEAKAAVRKAAENPNETAILARTNQVVGGLEDACGDLGKRAHTLGKSGFYRQEEIQHVMAYAQWVVEGSDAALKKVIRTPFRPTQMIAKADLLKVLKDTKEITDESYYTLLEKIPLADNQRMRVVGLRGLLGSLRSLNSLPASEAIEKIIGTTDAASHYENEDSANEDNFALANIDSLCRRAKKFQTLGDFVSHARKCANSKRKLKDAITIGTIHAAKGLEFKTVIVVGVAEGMLPHKKGDELEEKRVFFVAISRPANLLRLTYAGTPSTYIRDELPPTEEMERQMSAEQTFAVPVAQHTLF
jgi:DNA helicase-2/ATP-dependent DNA helicase PcrA